MKTWKMDINTHGKFKHCRPIVVTGSETIPSAIVRVGTKHCSKHFILVYDLDQETLDYYQIREWTKRDLLWRRIKCVVHSYRDQTLKIVQDPKNFEKNWNIDQKTT